MYIPMMSLPPVLPPYIQLDRSSQWHTSALLATAVESMTLPSRLRYTSSAHVTFDAMEAALNVNGAQRIANLQCSIIDPLVLKAEKSRAVNGSHDHRQPGTSTSDFMLDEDDPQMTTATLDVDYSCWGSTDSVTSLRHRHKVAHTLGQVETLRGDFEKHVDKDDQEVAHTRKRRRLANLPVVEKSVSNISACICYWLVSACCVAGCMYSCILES